MPLPRIIGVGFTPLGRLNRSAVDLAVAALDRALSDARLTRSQVTGLVCCPSLSHPQFMHGHAVARAAGMMPGRLVVQTIDVGGAGPVSALSTAATMLNNQWAECVAIVASDAVLSLNTKEFLKRADEGIGDESQLPSPRIPNGYDAVAQYQIQSGNVTREQLAMVSVLMSMNAAKHPDAMVRQPYTLAGVLGARMVGRVTSLLECARRADGAGAVILASEPFARKHQMRPLVECPVLLGAGEASGPLYPAPDGVKEDHFSCERAAQLAYTRAGLGPQDIDFWGLYDCFPVCFARSLEGVGLAPRGGAGAFIQMHYEQALRHGTTQPAHFPINTHGGLMCFGAPWEVPAIYNIIEAVTQLRGDAGVRQVPNARHALVYGNGGIFSASAVAILGPGNK